MAPPPRPETARRVQDAQDGAAALHVTPSDVVSISDTVRRAPASPHEVAYLYRQARITGWNRGEDPCGMCVLYVDCVKGRMRMRATSPGARTVRTSKDWEEFRKALHPRYIQLIRRLESAEIVEPKKKPTEKGF